MPIYEYVCQDCKKSFEKLVRTMTGNDRASCPKCGSSETARTLSVFAVGAQGGSKSSASQDVPMCGRCGGIPGSCQME